MNAVLFRTLHGFFNYQYRMVKHATLFCFILMSLSFSLWAQQTYVPAADDEYHLADRLETKSGSFSNDLFLTVRPSSRQQLFDFFSEEKVSGFNGRFTNVDNFNINRALSISGEWAQPNSDGAIASRQSLGPFYQKQSDAIYVNRQNFFFVANPILSLQGIYEQPNKKMLWNSTQGIEMRTRIADKVGAYLQLAHTYEEPVSFFDDYIVQKGAVPNIGPYKRSGNGYQYLQLRGYADIALIKDHINVSAGYDRQSVGDGYRSLFISDFSAPVPFVKINTKVWRLNYQNLYMALTPQQPSNPALRGGKYKYVSAHHLSVNITRWLNIGLFESVTFSRDGHFEIGYMNPVIFYRAVERGLGSPDKVALGINAKAIPVTNVQLYGQFLINEFTAKEFFSNRGYMHNKWGAQLGFKYFDAFTIANLDVQAEVNMIRPYTYQHYSEANYTNYNQPFAHPLGAGFREVVALARYQPIPRLSIDARFLYYRQGVDTGISNVGSNPLLSYREQTNNRYGINMINGVPVDCYGVHLNVAYEFRPRLYVEVGAAHRRYNNPSNLQPESNTTYYYGGIRLNIARRDYNQF
jgi:hypothetical protein